MNIVAKSRTAGLIAGLIILALVLPGTAAAASATPAWNAQYISDTIPAVMNASQSYSVSVTMKNTGSRAWSETDLIRLGAVGDSSGDAVKFGPSRIKILAGTRVMPGAQYTFSFTMTAPSMSGPLAPKYRMIQEGHSWFGSRAFQTVFVVKTTSAGSGGLPDARFAASPVQGTSPLVVQFTDQSSATGTVRYAWDVNNDGVVDYSTKNPSHTYAVPGTYTVNLTVANASGSDTESRSGLITVSSVTPAGTPPKAQFTANATQGTSPLIVQFTDQSTGTLPMTYHWDFSDGEGKLPENFQQNPVWRFWEDAGTSYTVTLTVTNAYGSDTIIREHYITLGTPPVATPPVAAFSSDVTTGNAPLTVQFTDQSGGSLQAWSWDFTNDRIPDSTQKNPSWTYTIAGTYTVNLTVTNPDGKDSEVKTGYIHVLPASAPPQPVAQFTANTTQGKSPLTVQFTDQSTVLGTSSYAWDFTGDGSTDSTVRNPTFTYPAAGNHTVKLTVTNVSGSDSEVKTGYIHVVSSPSAPALPAAQFTASATQGQAPLTVQFTDTSVSTGTSSCTWDLDNDGVVESTAKNPAYTYQTPGNYTVTLSVTNSSGTDNEIKTDYIRITKAVPAPAPTPVPVPTPVITPVPTQTPIVQSGICYGADCNPTGNPAGGGTGYSRIITGTEASVKYTVSSKAELLSALKSAKAGETIFVKGTAVIDLTGTPSVTIPAGVTLASDRGLAGSAGGLLKRTRNLNGGWEEPMLIAGGDTIRITGLRLEGEMFPQDYGNNDVYPGSISEQYYLVGIFAENRKGFEVDNCELYGWAWSSISLRQNSAAPIPYIHHNYIHNNQARGEGYGINLYGGNALIEANLFDYNRHDVTGAGMAGEQYEARYNHILGHGNAIGAAHFDVHQDEETGTGAAGAKFQIHHNTIDTGVVATVHIRARPTIGVYVDHNIINARASDTGVPGGLPVYETNSNQNLFCTSNYWMGTLYPANAGLVWYQ